MRFRLETGLPVGGSVDSVGDSPGTLRFLLSGEAAVGDDAGPCLEATSSAVAWSIFEVGKDAFGSVDWDGFTDDGSSRVG